MLSSIKSRIALLGLAAAMAFNVQAQNVTGAGASFVYPVMSKWTADYRKATKVQVNYQSIGSGGGIHRSRPVRSTSVRPMRRSSPKTSTSTALASFRRSSAAWCRW